MKKLSPLDLALERTGWITVPSAAARTGIHFTTLYRWIRTKKLSVKEVRRYKYVQIAELRVLLGDDVADELGLVAPSAPAKKRSARPAKA